ncbi:hypothetical protein EOM57_01035 [Candidatus Saccharibacteria bacterium]|nr:hypothetical protein [Candidatus Saccharibacteria bacterium]
MTALRLRKKSFYIKAKRFIGVSPQGTPKYAPCVEKVRGEVFIYLDRECAIYRADHTEDRLRKYDYIAIDVASGIMICRGSRKIQVLTTLEDKKYANDLLDYLYNWEHYPFKVKEFEKLKGETINGKNKIKV